MRDLTPNEINALRIDCCPDYLRPGLESGPRALDVNQNLLCRHCGARFNVFMPRYIVGGQRLYPEG
jgi:hypothetical protein